MRFCDQEWPEDTEVLDCVNEEIEDLEPLRALSGLRELRLSATNPHMHVEHYVRDLEPLAALTQLEVLELPRTKVADLAPLAGLSGLRRLDLSLTRVTDLARSPACGGWSG